MLIQRIFAGTVVAAAITVAAQALLPDTSLAVAAATPLQLTATPLALDRDNPARDRLGRLLFRGAIAIRADNPRFGGFSALRAGRGNRLLSVSDTGNWLAFDTIERDGRLVGADHAVLAPVLHPDGRPAATKADGDSEALEWDPATGIATISYEQDHRLVHFTGIDADRPASLAAVPVATERLTAMTGWPANNGGEAMAVLPGGARIVIAETERDAAGGRVALLTRNGVTTVISVEGLDDFSPTDAIALDDHRVLVLHRRFSTAGVGAALTLVDLAPVLGKAVPPATPLPAVLLARWQPPVTLDNMEGLALRRVDGHLFVYLISDDNLSRLQRTLLMKFELAL